MEKELKNYREHLRIQTLLNGILAIVCAAFVALGFLEIIKPVWMDEHWPSMWNGFISGVSTACLVLSLAGIIMNLRAFKDEKLLRKRYVKAHDERALAIQQRAGSLSYWYEAFGLILGIVVGGYFHPMISIVCLGCVVYMCLVRMALKLYYCRKI